MQIIIALVLCWLVWTRVKRILKKVDEKLNINEKKAINQKLNTDNTTNTTTTKEEISMEDKVKNNDTKSLKELAELKKDVKTDLNNAIEEENIDDILYQTDLLDEVKKEIATHIAKLKKEKVKKTQAKTDKKKTKDPYKVGNAIGSKVSSFINGIKDAF